MSNSHCIVEKAAERPQRGTRFAAIAIDQRHRTQGDHRQRDQVGPEAETLKGENVKRIVDIRAGTRIDDSSEHAQQHRRQRRGSTQA